MRSVLSLLLLICLLGLVLFVKTGFCQGDFQIVDKTTENVSLNTVVDLALQIKVAVQENHILPDKFIIQSTDNNSSHSITAAQALWLLSSAAEAYNSQEDIAIQLPPKQFAKPVLSPKESLENKGSIVLSAEALLNEGPNVLDFTFALGAYPNAVWVENQRITVAEYFQGIAAILVFINENGLIPERVRIIECDIPLSWRASKAKELNSPLLPLETPTEQLPLPHPTLSIFPGEGSLLTEDFDIVVNLNPIMEDAVILFYLDDELKCISNRMPFTMHLGKADLNPGDHKLCVHAEKMSGELIKAKEVNLTFSPQEELQSQRSSDAPVQTSSQLQD